MSDDGGDGFTMVDETFGVREASDCSDGEEEVSPHPTTTLPETLQLGNATRLIEEGATTASSAQPQPLRVSSGDNERDRAAVSSGMASSHGKESEDTKTTSNNGTLDMPRHSSTDPEIGRAPCKQGQVVSAADTRPLSAWDGAAACSRKTGWDSGGHKDFVIAGLAPVQEKFGDFLEPSSSNSVRSPKKDAEEEIEINNKPRVSVKHAAATTAMTAASPGQDSEASGVLRVEPSVSGILVRQTIDTVVGTNQNGHKAAIHDPTTKKTLVVRLLPGDCSFVAVVPSSGTGSITTVADLEREVQRQLMLREPLRLAIVNVCTANAQVISLSDAADGCTITARPVDRLLVLARVFIASNTTAVSSTQVAAVASPAPSTGNQFVLLPLRATWLETMEAAKKQLGVPPTRRVEVRHFAHSAVVEGHVATAAAVVDSSFGGDVPLTRVSSLRNGDTVVLSVLEEGPPVGADAGAGARTGFDNSVVSEKKPSGVRSGKGTEIGALLPRSSPITVPTERKKGEKTVDTNREAVKEAVDKLLVAGPIQLQPSLGRFGGTSWAEAGLPGNVPPRSRLHYYKKSNVASSDAEEGPQVGRENPPSAAPPRTLAAPHPTTPIDGVATPTSRPPPLAQKPFNPQHSAAPLPLPLPLPLPPSRARLRHTYPTSAATVDPFSTLPLGRTPPARAAFIDDTPKLKGSLSPPASAADEAAITELMGMGFEREHVVRALQECGRGESFKEAAISLLLEPQAASRFDGMTRHGGKTASQGLAGPAGPAPCPICISDIPPGEVFTVDCKEQHAFCVDCLYQHCSIQLLESGLIPACPMSNMACGHELSQEEVERVFLLKNYSSASNCKYAAAVSGEDEVQQSEQHRRALDTCGTLLTRRGLKSTGAVPCVSAECGNWMVPEAGVQRVRCSSCLTEFCGRCKRSPYHYAAECGDVVTLGREWALWLTEGRVNFLRAVAAQDDQHKTLLKKHEQKKREHDRAVEEAERLRLEYDNMENWKELRCRCCPFCGRTIEKLSGCDLMLCGVDAHGGNVQNGCGFRFDWRVARPYIGDRGVRKTTPFAEQEPVAAARSRHFIAEGIPLRCDRCHRDVVGPLFRCIHCPSFVCCLECQDTACRDPRHVHHTFEVVTAEDNASTTSAPAAAASSGGRWGGGGGRGGGGGGGGAYDMDVDDLV